MVYVTFSFSFRNQKCAEQEVLSLFWYICQEMGFCIQYEPEPGVQKREQSLL